MGAAGGIESEVKLRVAQAAEARARLESCGARLTRARHFEDNLLLDDERGTLRAAGVALRLRRTREGQGEQFRLTLKGPRRVEGGIKSREEIELSVSDGDALQALFERLGYRPRFRYQKYRETWSLDGLEVVVDETPIGCFFEVEGLPQAIPGVARRLGYGPQDYLADSYVALFLAGGGQGDMVFA